jgi:uncharacterized protein (DUF433 family)
MALAVDAEPLPLTADQDGVLRIAGTRVTLATVVGAFNAGATPEDIVLRYESLRLGEVYLVLGYYLRHRGEVDAYLAERQLRVVQNQAAAEARLPWSDVRARLLARQQELTHPTPRGG